eukprot:2905357-Pyramimonas_sp.AAC.1
MLQVTHLPALQGGGDLGADGGGDALERRAGYARRVRVGPPPGGGPESEVQRRTHPHHRAGGGLHPPVRRHRHGRAARE